MGVGRGREEEEVGEKVRVCGVGVGGETVHVITSERAKKVINPCDNPGNPNCNSQRASAGLSLFMSHVSSDPGTLFFLSERGIQRYYDDIDGQGGDA